MKKIRFFSFILCIAMFCTLLSPTAFALSAPELDGQAAHEAGARFYPILPGREEESWKRFREEILPLFLSGGYTAQEEEKYAAPLREMLS